MLDWLNTADEGKLKILIATGLSQTTLHRTSKPACFSVLLYFTASSLKTTHLPSVVDNISKVTSYIGVGYV